jgi:hypothetical protein
MQVHEVFLALPQLLANPVVLFLLLFLWHAGYPAVRGLQLVGSAVEVTAIHSPPITQRALMSRETLWGPKDVRHPHSVELPQTLAARQDDAAYQGAGPSAQGQQ